METLEPKPRHCPKCGHEVRFYKVGRIGPRQYAEYKCDNQNTTKHAKRYIFRVRIK